MNPAIYGVLADGRACGLATLAWPHGLTVEVLAFGAAVHSIRVATPNDGPLQVVLSHDSLAGYEADGDYLGPIVGRCANRIAGAAFEIDGQTFHISANEGANTLHGGVTGFNKRLWEMEPLASDGRSVSLTYVSPDGEEGFPGQVEVRATYTIVAADTLEIGYSATCDAPTLVNLSQHLYFNLSGAGRGDILNHRLRIAGEAITPVRPDLIPTGALMPVQDTPFDLRTPVRIGEAIGQSHPQLAIPKGFDHNWVLDGGRTQGASDQPALELHSPATGVTLELTTDQPGLQVYSGQGLKTPFQKHGAIVFEPQGFPDAVHHPDFPSVVLRPGETYRHLSRYRFHTGAPS